MGAVALLFIFAARTLFVKVISKTVLTVNAKRLYFSGLVAPRVLKIISIIGEYLSNFTKGLLRVFRTGGALVRKNKSL